MKDDRLTRRYNEIGHESSKLTIQYEHDSASVTFGLFI
jgi:hypothetical protein